MVELTEATLSVQQVAKILKKDSQTVRVLLQQGLVSWGMAYKLPNSRHYSYLIYAKRFYEETGYKPHDIEITDRVAVDTLDSLIEECENKLSKLNENTQEYCNVQMLLRDYERQWEQEIWGW